jgi:uncharacterized protein
VTRFEAFLLLRKRLRDRSRVRVCLAAEAVMEDLARRLGEDPDTWGLAGLLHDVDHEFTDQNPKRRGKVAAEIARNEGAPEGICRALAGFRGPGPHPDLLTNALAAGVPAAMIILEVAESREGVLRIADQDLANILDDPSIAPTASRTRIASLTENGLDPAAVLGLALLGVQRVASDVFPS